MSMYFWLKDVIPKNCFLTSFDPKIKIKSKNKERRYSMSKVISAIYEDGIFKPLEDIHLPDHQRVRLEITSEEEASLVESQKKALFEIAGIGNSGLNDVGRKHDNYLYLKDR
jgi:predicted DNA-binding antitoxin AbrB/MazE fold protein